MQYTLTQEPKSWLIVTRTHTRHFSTMKWAASYKGSPDGASFDPVCLRGSNSESQHLSAFPLFVID